MKKVVRAIETVIGKIAEPKHVRIVPKIVERIRVMVQGEAKVATSRSAVNSGVRLSASAVKVIRSGSPGPDTELFPGDEPLVLRTAT